LSLFSDIGMKEWWDRIPGSLDAFSKHDGKSSFIPLSESAVALSI